MTKRNRRLFTLGLLGFGAWWLYERARKGGAVAPDVVEEADATLIELPGPGQPIPGDMEPARASPRKRTYPRNWGEAVEIIAPF